MIGKAIFNMKVLDQAISSRLALFLFSSHGQREKNNWMSQDSNPGKLAPQADDQSITPWPLGPLRSDFKKVDHWMQTTVGVGKMKQFRHVGLVQHDVAGVAERQHGWRKNRPIKKMKTYSIRVARTSTKTLRQWGSSRCKHNFRWQHLSRIKKCIILIDKTVKTGFHIGPVLPSQLMEPHY